MDAGGAVATALWGSFPVAGGMHGGMHGDGGLGGLQSMSSSGPSFAPHWSSAATAFVAPLATQSGRSLPDQPVASRRVSHEYPCPELPQATLDAGPPRLSPTDDEMPASFGKKLSLTEITFTANNDEGGPNAAGLAAEPGAAALQRFGQSEAIGPGRNGRLIKKSGSDEDVFSAVGGMELGRHDLAGGPSAPSMLQTPSVGSAGEAVAPPSQGLGQPLSGTKATAADSGSSFGGPAIGDLPFSETPSRTLIVRNVTASSADQDLQQLFEAYGEIRTLYTACKARGLVTVSYFDLRAACLAMHSLAGAPLGDALLEVQYPVPSEQSAADREEGVVTVYNLDPSISLDELYHSFVTFGDVKDIRDLPGRVNSKVIEFYDVRHASAAFKALHRSGSKPSLDHSTLPSVPELSSPAMHSPASQENLSGWIGPSSIDSARSSQDRLTPMYSLESIKSGGAASGLASSSLDSRLGSGMLPGQAAYSQAQQEALQQARALTSLSADGMLGGSGGRMMDSMGGAGIAAGNPEPQNSYSYCGDGPSGGGYSAADALAALGRMHSAGSLVGDGSMLRSPGHGGQVVQPISGQSAFGSAAAQQLHSVASGVMGSRGMSMSTGDIASALEAQQLHQQLLQRRVSAAVPDAASMWNAHSSGPMGGGSGSLGTSPGGLGPDSVAWAAMQHQQQQQQQQQAALNAAQLGQAQRIHAALVCTPGLQNVTLEQVHALLVSGGLNTALPGVLMRSQSASAMLQHQLAPLAARQAAAMLNKAGSGNVMGRPQLGRSGSRDRDLGGRAARRSADSTADMERRSAQERMFALDLEKVLSGEDTRTTLMIKNIPNKYTQKMLLAAIDESFRGTYDFFYLPIDFKNKCNVGYAFINMIQPVYIIAFVDRFNYRKWEKFNSEKVCQISYARIQGKQAMVQHFQNSSLLQEDKRCRPVLFHSSGPNAGESEAFPMGPAVRTRARGPSREGSRDLKLGGVWG